MPDNPVIDADALCAGYLSDVTALMQSILVEERDALDRAATRVADQVAGDRLVYVYGPGGHSNLAAQEIFFRAGGLMHVSAILDEGTLLSNGALRSMAVERTPGYGKIVIDDQRLGEGDLLLLTNAYGINAALINGSAPTHPARHPTKQNLHDIVDIAIDTKVPIGDALVTVDGVSENIAAVSTFANAFALNCLVIRTVAKLAERGVESPIWRSGNAPGGDEANGRFLARFRDRVRWL